MDDWPGVLCHNEAQSNTVSRWVADERFPGAQLIIRNYFASLISGIEMNWPQYLFPSIAMATCRWCCVPDNSIIGRANTIGTHTPTH